MASTKMNLAVIRSVIDALAKAGLDPTRARPVPPGAGLFAPFEDRLDAERAPAHIINLLKNRAEKGEPLSAQETKRFVEKEVWSRSFMLAKAAIIIDLAAGASPKRHINEAREAIDVLRRMGEPEAEWFEGFLKKAIGEE